MNGEKVLTLSTPRTLLRPWRESDAPRLYELAKSPNVGPAAGWLPHKSEAESLQVIRTVLLGSGTFAVVLKENEQVIGAASVTVAGNDTGSTDEASLGYWLGEPYWGRGIMPEVVRALLEYAFITLKLERVWLSYFDENDRSRRVAEKCGFPVDHTFVKTWPMGIKHETACVMTKENYLSTRGARKV